MAIQYSNIGEEEAEEEDEEDDEMRTLFSSVRLALSCVPPPLDISELPPPEESESIHTNNLSDEVDAALLALSLLDMEPHLEDARSIVRMMESRLHRMLCVR